jgi:hypothetical protein
MIDHMPARVDHVKIGWGRSGLGIADLKDCDFVAGAVVADLIDEPRGLLVVGHGESRRSRQNES